jgi:hypothetical protein
MTYVEINVPRIHFGADSDWYSGIRDEINPTPAPAIARPATKSGMAVAIVCITTPAVKTTQATSRISSAFDLQALDQGPTYSEYPFVVRPSHRSEQRSKHR